LPKAEFRETLPLGKIDDPTVVPEPETYRSGRIVIQSAEQFGAAVSQARKGLGLTQRELALAIDSGERFIVDLEAGKPTAQLGKALAAAWAVGLRLTF
jgi:HTH-type transcriptional regulator / antitoxin HipB